ncbi:alpha-glucosidase family protein [Hydromonas duriensis]|uniref:Alpha-glucosidase n=1 Tax=Hydromonas duriensis TaxID=1527608 RepID=A0A4R6YC06_9BURK|nr:alpha-glucosidase family protein [Hydromonas duriensis]TDR33183.1 alpha-glucosidase [Hydromonas duriensis]
MAVFLQHSANQDEPEWWRGAVIYQIYPRSYQDSNGDGIGDLQGIVSRLPYIASLGVDAVWLSPFFKSPMKDFGYDVSDYCQVDPMFGTLDDFKVLLKTAHDLGLRVVIDQVLSHTSDAHPWFVESRSSKNNPKADWYVWADAKDDGTPPNNWLSIFGGSAWQWDTGREQYYMHNFLTSQPDLNFHHPEVEAALFGVMMFWLDLGVDGFRLDTANFYVHDKQLRNNPPRGRPQTEDGSAPSSNPYAWQYHRFDKSQAENIVFVKKLREFLDQYPGIMTVGELGDDDPVGIMIAYTEGADKLNMAYSFKLLGEEHQGAYVRSAVDEYESRATEGCWPSWSLSNHDVKRLATRWSADGAALRTYAAMQLCVRGSPCVYQGDELGLPEAELTFEQLQDPYGITMWPAFKGRDGCRTPMPWEKDQLHAGFSSTEKTWLPVAHTHYELAVDQQEIEGSLLNFYRECLHKRKQLPILLKGSMTVLPAQGDALVFVRELDGRRMLCAFNLSAQAMTYHLPDEVRVQELADFPQTKLAASVGQKDLVLGAWQTVVAWI